MPICARSTRCSSRISLGTTSNHDAILHPDFICIGGNGARTARAAYLKRWATGFDAGVIVYWDVWDEFITVVGNVALVRATNKEIVSCMGPIKRR